MATINKVIHKVRAKKDGSTAVTNNKPKVTYRVVVDKSGYKRVRFTSATLAEAKKKAGDIEAAMNNGTWDEEKQEAIKEGNTILSAIIEKYLEEVSPFKDGGKPLLKYETGTLHEIASHRVGKMDMYKIKTPDINSLKTYLITRVAFKDLDPDHQHSLKKKPSLKPSSVNRKLNVLQGVFTEARLRWGIDMDNPVREMLYKKADKPSIRKVQAFEIEEAITFLKAASNPYPWWLFELSLETGARRKELFENVWGNVDFEARLLTIPAHIEKNRNERKAPLSPRAIEILKLMEKHDNPEKVDMLAPITIDSFKSAWRRAMKDCTVDVQFRDARPIAITALSKIYPRCQSLAKISGHTNLKTLLRYYRETDEERVEQMDEFHKSKN